MSYEIDYTDKFKNDLKKHTKSGQKKLVDKVANFVREVKETPTSGTGQVEALKGFGERQIFSRRIDKKHRLVYEVFEDEKRVEILSAYGHYED